MTADDRKKLTDRELAELTHARLDKIEARLFDGDIEIGMCMNSIRTLCQIAGARDAEQELAAYIAEKRKRMFGNGEKELPTGPGDG